MVEGEVGVEKHRIRLYYEVSYFLGNFLFHKDMLSYLIRNCLDEAEKYLIFFCVGLSIIWGIKPHVVQQILLIRER